MAGHHSRFSHRSRSSSRGESNGHGPQESGRVREMKNKTQALDLRIAMIKKAIAASKVFAKDLQQLGLSKEDAGRLALNLFEISVADDDHHGHGGH